MDILHKALTHLFVVALVGLWLLDLARRPSIFR